MNILLEKNYAIVKYNAHHQLISLHFIQKVSFQEYKEVLHKIIEFIKEHHAPRLLIDQRFGLEANIEERAWFISKWFPQLEEVVESTFKLGFVAPKSRFDKIGAEYVVKTLVSQSPFLIELFNTTDEALTWFEE